MRTEYKVIKPFGCAKIGDIFNFDSDDREFVMEDTKTTKKGTNSRFMSINEEYVDALVKGGNLEPYGSEVTEQEEETLPTIAELKLIALEAFINDCKTKYESNLDKVRKDFEEGKIQPCLKLESETVNQNLLKLINAIQQILDVDKEDNE
jgi:hypothetical protein